MTDALGKTVLVFLPHADDAAAFCGGTVARMSDTGWRVVLVRITDDWSDSVGLSRDETIRRNRIEFQEAARILGAHEIVELEYPTDTLADVSRVALRERFVYLLRKYRPERIMGFDPYASFEPNLDHVVCAQALEEALWVACFELHHPEHLAEGLAVHSVHERFYFARRLPEVNHAEDITDYLNKRVAAMCAHRTMAANIVHQVILQLRTAGRVSPLLEDALHGDKQALFEMTFSADAAANAAQQGLPEGHLAEVFRVERFGALDPLIEAISQPL